MESMNHRLAVAERRFWAEKQRFTSRDIFLNERVRDFCRVLLASGLHGSECWVWSVGTCNHLRRWENEMLRRIVNLPRKLDETWLQWHRRNVKIGEYMLQTKGLDGALMKWLRKLHIVSMDMQKSV